LNETQNLLGAALLDQQEYTEPDQTERWRKKLKANHTPSTSQPNHGQP
jgi:fatty acid-binding protein DegV